MKKQPVMTKTAIFVCCGGGMGELRGSDINSFKINANWSFFIESSKAAVLKLEQEPASHGGLARNQITKAPEFLM